MQQKWNTSKICKSRIRSDIYLCLAVLCLQFIVVTCGMYVQMSNTAVCAWFGDKYELKFIIL